MFDKLTMQEAATLQGFLGDAARRLRKRQQIIDNAIASTGSAKTRLALIVKYEAYRSMILELRAINLDVMNRAS